MTGANTDAMEEQAMAKSAKSSTTIRANRRKGKRKASRKRQRARAEGRA
jgi:hypothetical protein